MSHTVTKQRRCLKDRDTVRSVKAFVVGRLGYGLLFQKLNKAEMTEVKSIIRAACKAALGLPRSTSTERLEGLGTYNTYEEYATAVVVVQNVWIRQNKQGPYCKMWDISWERGMLVKKQCGFQTNKRDKSSFIISNEYEQGTPPKQKKGALKDITK